MTTKASRTNSTPIAAALPDPRELESARALREALVEWNAGMNERAKLADSDRAALEAMKGLVEQFLSETYQAFAGLAENRNAPPAVGSFENEIRAFTMNVVGTTNRELPSGGFVAIPAIQDEAVRSYLAQTGTSLVQKLDDLIELAWKRCAKEVEEAAKLRARVEYWLQFEPVRAVIRAHFALASHSATRGTGLESDVLDVLKRTQHRLEVEQQRADETVPAPLPTYGVFWKAWIDVAQAILDKAV